MGANRFVRALGLGFLGLALSTTSPFSQGAERVIPKQAIPDQDVIFDGNLGLEVTTTGVARGAAYLDFSGLVKKVKNDGYFQVFKVFGEFMPGPEDGAGGVPRLDLIFVPFVYLKKHENQLIGPIVGGPSFEYFRDTLLKNIAQYNLRAFQVGFSKTSEKIPYFITASVNMGGWEYVELNKGAGNFGVHGIYVAGTNINMGYFFKPGKLKFRHTVLNADASFGTAGTQGSLHTDVDVKLPLKGTELFPYLRAGGRFDSSFDLLQPNRPELANAHSTVYGFFQFGIKGSLELHSLLP